MKLQLPEGKKVNEVWLCSPNKIIAFGEVLLEENDPSQTVIVNIEYLIDGLNALKTIGLDNIELRVQNDYPLFIVDKDDESPEKEHKLKGMLIAPRIYD